MPREITFTALSLVPDGALLESDNGISIDPGIIGWTCQAQRGNCFELECRTGMFP